jgi:hypothetical protein
MTRPNWKLVSVYLGTVLILTQDRCTVFYKSMINSLVMWVLWNLVLVHLEIVLILMEDRCTVCSESTMGSKIICDAPDGTPW